MVFLVLLIISVVTLNGVVRKANILIMICLVG